MKEIIKTICLIVFIIGCVYGNHLYKKSLIKSAIIESRR